MQLKSSRGISVLEYTLFLVVLMSAFLAFRFYFTGAYNGQMRKTGESFAFGRQYDPRRSIACTYDDKLFVWYSDACYDHQIVVDACDSKVDKNACPAWADPQAVLASLPSPVSPFGIIPSTPTLADNCPHRRCLYEARVLDLCQAPCRQ